MKFCPQCGVEVLKKKVVDPSGDVMSMYRCTPCKLTFHVLVGHRMITYFALEKKRSTEFPGK